MIPGLIVNGGWLSGSLIAIGAVLLLVLLYWMLAGLRRRDRGRRGSVAPGRPVLREQYRPAELSVKRDRGEFTGPDGDDG